MLDLPGTPAFVAPEQIFSARFGPEADIFALAMTIYVILARAPAYDARTPREHLFAHIHRDPIPLRRRNRSWPAELDRALARSLSRHPGERHPSADQLAADVATALRPHTPLRLISFFDGSLSRFSSGEIPINF